MDAESESWLNDLGDRGVARSAAHARLHQLLLKVAFHEAYRRGPAARITGPELEDLAHQAADDSMVSLLGKLDAFRGESRFTTWAYRFVVLEVSNKVARHYSHKPSVSLDAEDWDRLPAQFGADPAAQTQHRDMVAAVRHAVDETLTPHQRKFFVACVINGIPMDAVAEKTGTKLNAIYKTVFDARRKIRTHLTTNGYINDEPKVGKTAGGRVKVTKI